TADGFDITAKTSNSVTGPAVMNVEVINTGDFPELGGVTDGLEMWFDAADIDAGNNGSVGDPGNGQIVQTWRDKSGKNHHATRATQDPVVLGNKLNGLPVVEAIGEEYWNVPGNTFIKTTFSVFRAGAGRTRWDNHGATLNRRSGRGSNWLFENNNTTLHGNQYPQRAWKNGASLGSPFNMGNINEFMIFTVEVNNNDAGPREHWLGRSDHSQTDLEMAEVIAYDRVLSAGERQAVESYLGAKWGVGAGGGNPATETKAWTKVWDAIDEAIEEGDDTTGPLGGANVVNYASDVEASFDYAGGGNFGVNRSPASINSNGPGGGGGPVAGGDNYSVRADGYLQFDNAGTYTIAMGSDDGRQLELREAFEGSAPDFAGFSAKHGQVAAPSPFPGGVGDDIAVWIDASDINGNFVVDSVENSIQNGALVNNW
ncbi:MAG: hypothetical protein VX257_07465, partial [Planctomycetota bacterium]|nr:hypothetical protein [Planctomycetota bacterium]